MAGHGIVRRRLARGPAGMLGALLAAAVGLAGLAGCGAPAVPRGGASALPGPLPEGVVIAPEQTGQPLSARFNLTLVDGNVVDASTLWADRPVILFFFASWCGPCAAQQDHLSELDRRYGDALPILGIAGQDDLTDVRAFLDAHEVQHAVGMDSDDLRIWSLYAVREPPLVAVIGPGGRLMRGYPGGADPATLDALVETLVTRE